MTVVLYNAPQSTCSQRVRFVLNAKGLAFEEHKLNLLDGDQLKPDYLAINPNGVVPSLLHDGVAIIDSAVIVEYLDEAFPDVAPMRPGGLAELARMRTMMRFIDEVPAAAVRVPTFNLAFLPRLQAMSKAEFQAFAEAKPLRREFMQAMGQTGFPQKDMDQATERLRRSVLRMDDWLAAGGGPWLMGRQLTLADISLMPAIVRCDDLNLHTLWADKPAVARWLDAIRAQPAFRPTYYHGALLTEQFPHLSAMRAARRAG